MTVLAFSMTGEPRGKERARHTVRTAKSGRSFVSTYTPAKTRAYESSIRDIAITKMAGRAPFEGPISLSVRIRLAVPVSMSKKQRARIMAGEEAYFGAIDWDNGAKALCDAFNGVVWGDDKQVTRAFVEKVAAEQPGLDVRVEAFAPQVGE